MHTSCGFREQKRKRSSRWLRITAMFAFFNRVADAFGVAPQGYLEMNKMTK
jgi:hypothetical protein